MEKQRVNDTVVRLGNLILKARVHVAHRLSSKIRTLRAKKDEKFSKRIERLLLEIAYLKTLSKSGTRKAVARTMLLNSDDVSARIERESTSPEERAFCRLCKTKFIENFISKFREENVDWKYWVPPLLAMWEKKVEMKKSRILKPESSEESKRPSVREIAEARKRKMDSDDSEDPGNRCKRTKQTEALPDRQKKRKKQSKAAGDRFTVEPIKKSHNPREVGSAADSEKTREKSTSGGACEEVESKKLSVSGVTARGDVTSPLRQDDDERQSSSSPEVCQVPFRPYAPKYFVRGSGSEDSGSADDDDTENDGNRDHGESEKEDTKDSRDDADSEDEDRRGNCEDDGEEEESGDDSVNAESGDESVEEATPLRKKPASSAISVEELEKVLDSDKNDESDQCDEGSSEEEDDEGDSDGEHSDGDDSEREREFEERIERKFKANGTKETVKIPVSSYEPESSEEEFPTQRMMDSGRNDGKETKVDDDDVRAPSFFLRKGEQPEEVQSRTIPKERAPGLNRRQRRGHEKQGTSTSAQDESDDAEPRSNMTFGKDFRPRRSFQNHQRPQAPDRNKFHERNSSGTREFPNGRPRSGKDQRSSFPGRSDRFQPQGGQRKSMNFSRDSKFDPNERRFSSRTDGRSDRKQERFSERSTRPAQKPMDRERWEQRRDSSFSAPRRSEPQDTSRQATEEKLHPSWLAKKKLSASLNQPFQGKKIVFDD